MPEILEQDLIAGTTWKWNESFSDYPSSEYTCQIALKKSSGTPVLISSEADGSDGFDFSKTAALSGAITNGDYLFQYIFTKIIGGDVKAPKELSGSVPIIALLSSSSDTRSDDQKVLDALIAARQKIAERDYENMSNNGKAATFKKLQEIDAEINRYKSKLGLIQQPVFLNAL